MREDGGDGRGRDAVVLEVDEAGALEALQEGGGGGEARGGVGGARVLGEVDELGGSVRWVGEGGRWKVGRTGMKRSSFSTAESTLAEAMVERAALLLCWEWMGHC